MSLIIVYKFVVTRCTGGKGGEQRSLRREEREREGVEKGETGSRKATERTRITGPRKQTSPSLHMYQMFGGKDLNYSPFRCSIRSEKKVFFGWSPPRNPFQFFLGCSV